MVLVRKTKFQKIDCAPNNQTNEQQQREEKKNSKRNHPFEIEIGF